MASPSKRSATWSGRSAAWRRVTSATVGIARFGMAVVLPGRFFPILDGPRRKLHGIGTPGWLSATIFSFAEAPAMRPRRANLGQGRWALVSLREQPLGHSDRQSPAAAAGTGGSARSQSNIDRGAAASGAVALRQCSAAALRRHPARRSAVGARALVERAQRDRRRLVPRRGHRRGAGDPGRARLRAGAAGDRADRRSLTGAAAG